MRWSSRRVGHTSRRDMHKRERGLRSERSVWPRAGRMARPVSTLGRKWAEQVGGVGEIRVIFGYGLFKMPI